MSGEDQERFEDYLELERYIAELQAGRRAALPQDITPAQARVYRQAALFRSASSIEAAEPRPEFAAELYTRLLNTAQENGSLTSEQPEQSNAEKAPTTPVTSANKQTIVPEAPTSRVEPKKARWLSRRSMLSGGAVAAASLAVGMGAGALVSKQPVANGNQSYKDGQLALSGKTDWIQVATLAQLGEHAVKFVTDTVIGYVMLNDSDANNPTKGPVRAFSAACTHKGCIVRWDEQDQQFHCPCHGGLFSEYGQPAKGSPMSYLAALPLLNTKVEHGNVYVELPANGAAGQANTEGSW